MLLFFLFFLHTFFLFVLILNNNFPGIFTFFSFLFYFVFLFFFEVLFKFLNFLNFFHSERLNLPNSLFFGLQQHDISLSLLKFNFLLHLVLLPLLLLNMLPVIMQHDIVHTFIVCYYLKPDLLLFFELFIERFFNHVSFVQVFFFLTLLFLHPQLVVMIMNFCPLVVF
jgi:hypothetical protein